jgi:hypothetical protein
MSVAGRILSEDCYIGVMGADPAYLEELVDSNEFDRLFELVILEEAAQTWCSYQLREHTTDEEFDPDWWAVQLMLDLEQEDRRRQLLARIVELAPNDHVLGVAGAGPLEDFLDIDRFESENLGVLEERLQWIEQQAAVSEKFRKALGDVWVHGNVSPETHARLERASGGEYRRPPGAK